MPSLSATNIVSAWVARKAARIKMLLDKDPIVEVYGAINGSNYS